MSLITNTIEPTSINDVARLIQEVGDDITVIVESEPGCGKTSILKMLAEANGDEWRKDGDACPNDTHEYAYIDCCTVGDGDMGTMIPVMESKTMDFFVSKLLKLASGKPIVIMLDEFLKVNKLLKPMFTKLILERVIGDMPLPEGSKVFATSNNSSDGVNDTIEAHVGNRVLRIQMAKPDHIVWNLWATKNKMSALVRSWVTFKPNALHSYKTCTPDQLSTNEFIFNPSKPAVTFVSPRSLEKADRVLSKRTVLGDTLTKAALAGVVGPAAAESLMMFARLEKDLVPVPVILKDPETTPVPTSVGPLLMTLFKAVDELTNQDELTRFLKWVGRIESSEYREVFYAMICSSARTARMARQNAQMNEWFTKEDNYKIVN